MIENNLPVSPSRKFYKHKKMADSNCKLKVAIDCSFDEYMSDKAIAHVVQQLQYCYSANRRAENSIQLFFTGVNGRLHERFTTIGDVKGWDVNYETRHYSEIFGLNGGKREVCGESEEVKEPQDDAEEVKDIQNDAEEMEDPHNGVGELKEPEKEAENVKEPQREADEIKEPQKAKEPETEAGDDRRGNDAEARAQVHDCDVVYLSSESENVLQTLDSNTCYVIGGLIDYNHHKGLCHRLAVERGVRHARLPISKYLNLNTRHVLTINHVFEILLKYSENGDWGRSMCEVIPNRKAAEIKEEEQVDGDDEEQNKEDSKQVTEAEDGEQVEKVSDTVQTN